MLQMKLNAVGLRVAEFGGSPVYDEIVKLLLNHSEYVTVESWEASEKTASISATINLPSGAAPIKIEFEQKPERKKDESISKKRK